MSRLPAVRDAMLIPAAGAAPLAVGGADWFAWLDGARSFSYAGAAGTFTARHETRSGRHFWYAYRQREGTLRKAYLGRTADLTPDRLEAAARELADGSGPATRRDARDDAQPPLIATKIAVPQPGPSLIARPAVLARCLEAVERPCAIVAASPGFGKTTLLIEACARLCERAWQIAWVSLEEADRDPARFWAYVLAALGAARPGVDAAARRLLEMPRPAPAERMLTALVNALADDSTPLVLVLDDYHRAATEASDAGLTFLIEHAPAALHLVVASRGNPALPLARLRAQGRVAELHAADLRFTADESARFFRETMGLSLPSDRLARLAERTEGWPAGLQLSALSLREQVDVPDAPDLPAAPPQYIAEYLIAEVLDHQPPDVQAFLLRTAPLERLSGPLCDVVTGGDDGAVMLARLMQAQLFVTPLDPARIWYRYHHLFAGVLRDRLAQTAPETLAQVHRSAAEWLRQQGMTDEAIRHLLAASAFDDAAALIERVADGRILRGEIAGLIAQAGALPRDVILDHPHICVLFAVALLLRGEMPEAAAWLDALEQRLPERGAESSARETRWEIGVVRAIMLLMAGDLPGGVTLAREAAERLSSGNAMLRSLALWLTGIMGVFGEENLADVIRSMGDIVAESLQTGNMLVAFLALVTRAGIEMYQGRLRQAAQTCREALRLVPDASGQELPTAAMGYSVLGEIRREWNDLDAAYDDLRRAVAIGMDLSNREFLDDGLMALAMLQAERGEYDAAQATFDHIAHLVRTRQLAPWDLDLMEYQRVRVLIMQGQVAEVARWADERRRLRRDSRPILTLPLMRELEDLALARASLAQGDPAPIIAPLERICAEATPAERLRNVLDARMLLARARWMAGEAGAALRELDAALTLAAPEGFQRIFLDEGAPMADLLAAYVAARPPSRQRTHALTLLAAFGRAVEPSALPTGETLSPRELDVLRLLAAGRSNDGIAAELVVARSTVKWHVAQIYRKLGVGGRLQAVARARELHLVA